MDNFYKNNNNRSFLKSIVFLKLIVKTATSGPPIGAILGQCGIPAGPFCKEFNERTLLFKDNVMVQVILYVFINGEYNFDIVLPPNSFFIKKITSLTRGFSKPGYIYSDIQELKNKNLYLKYKYVTPFMIYEVLNYRKKHNLITSPQFYSNYKKLIGVVKSIGIFYNI